MENFIFNYRKRMALLEMPRGYSEQSYVNPSFEEELSPGSGHFDICRRTEPVPGAIFIDSRCPVQPPPPRAPFVLPRTVDIQLAGQNQRRRHSFPSIGGPRMINEVNHQDTFVQLAHQIQINLSHLNNQVVENRSRLSKLGLISAITACVAILCLYTTTIWLMDHRA